MFWDAQEGMLAIRHPSTLPMEAWEGLADWQRTGAMRTTWPHGETGEADVVLVLIATDVETRRDAFSSASDDLLRRALSYMRIPPLRDRPEDVVLYLEHYLRETGLRFRGEVFTLRKNFEDAALLALVNHSWADNLLGVMRAVELMVLTGLLKETHDRVTVDQARMVIGSSLGLPGHDAAERVKRLIRSHGRSQGRSRYPGKEAMENFDREIIQQGWSQLEVARALGVSDGTLCRWRRKAALPELPVGRPPKTRLPVP